MYISYKLLLLEVYSKKKRLLMFYLFQIYDRQDGIQLYSLTGYLIPDDIWSNANYLFITFMSDHSSTFLGFSIDVYMIHI